MVDRELIKQLQSQINARKQMLAGYVDEYEHLVDIMEVLDYWQDERSQTSSSRKFERYISTLDQGETFKPSDLTKELDIKSGSANYWIGKAVKAGFLERWGKGLYRRPLNKTGEARLRVAT